MVHCRGGRVSTEGPEGRGRAWGRPLGSALLGQTPPGAHAARSPRCPGDGCPPVTPGFESLGPSCAFPRLLSQVVLAGPPLGLPASPPCPSVSCSPHASHRQTARSSLHLPTTGECGPAGAWGGRVGAGSAASACPGGGQCHLCPSWSRWPGQCGAAVARASRRRDRGFARGERPAGPGTRGVRKAWRVCVGTRSPQGERGAGAPCGEARGRRWRWLLVGHPALSGQGRGPSEETGRGHASGAWPRGCWEPQKRLSRAGAWLVWFSLKLRRRPGGLGCRGGRWAVPLFGEGPQGARE